MTSKIVNGMKRILTPINYVSNKYKGYIERHKGGAVEKWAIYWKGLSADYKEVAKDVVKDARQRPLKASFVCAGLGLVIVGLNSNPTVLSFRTQLIESSNRLSLVNPSLKNQKTDDHINHLLKCYNEGLIRRLSFGVLSLLWIDNYNRALDLYSAQCSYLKPRYITFYERIVDVGAFDRWLLMDYKMIDYDVNDQEWQ